MSILFSFHLSLFARLRLVALQTDFVHQFISKFLYYLSRIDRNLATFQNPHLPVFCSLPKCHLNYHPFRVSQSNRYVLVTNDYFCLR